MAVRLTMEQADQIYQEQAASLENQEAAERFKQHFPTVDVYIDWLEYIIKEEEAEPDGR